MKRLIASFVAGTLLAALPLAALAHDDDRRYGGRGDDYRRGYSHDHGWKHGHKHAHKHGYGYGPPRVVHHTRVIEHPVYVPAPVVYPHPRPFPLPVNSVDIGFRLFF